MVIYNYSDIKQSQKDVFNALFSNQDYLAGEQAIKLQKTDGGLRFFEMNGSKIIEQNPKKDSAFADLAKAGRLILWVIPEDKKTPWWCIIKDLTPFERILLKRLT